MPPARAASTHREVTDRPHRAGRRPASFEVGDPASRKAFSRPGRRDGGGRRFPTRHLTRHRELELRPLCRLASHIDTLYVDFSAGSRLDAFVAAVRTDTTALTHFKGNPAEPLPKTPEPARTRSTEIPYDRDRRTARSRPRSHGRGGARAHASSITTTTHGSFA